MTNLPLSGIKVLELGQLIAGLFAIKMLAEFGAHATEVLSELGVSSELQAKLRERGVI